MTPDEIRGYQAAGVITERQAHILEYRNRGLSRLTIARGLLITVSTVRSLEQTALIKITRHNLTARKDDA